jgi:hypothetical protein
MSTTSHAAEFPPTLSPEDMELQMYQELKAYGVPTVYAMNCEGVIGEYVDADKVQLRDNEKVRVVMMDRYQQPLWFSASVEALRKVQLAPTGPIALSMLAGTTRPY